YGDVMAETKDARTRAKVRSVLSDASEKEQYSNVINHIYDDALDLFQLRNAFPAEAMADLARKLDRDRDSISWARPNAVMPPADIFLLGTDTPATPTFKTPRGASLEAYLESASRHDAATAELVSSQFDFITSIEETLSQLAGGKPVSVPVSTDGRRYVPYTLRLLGDGKQIPIHNDYHYPLALYK